MTSSLVTETKGYRFLTHTFGCKVNTYDSGLLQKNLEKHGYVYSQAHESPEVHLLNSCAVTQEASKEALRVARRIRSKNPLAKIVLTGCAAQVDTEMFENVPTIDLVVANSHKAMIPFLIDDLYKGKIQQKVFKSNIFKKESLEEGGGIEESHTRSFLKIQDGCNSFCTYCVIPFARGKSRSIPIKNLVERVRGLHQHGVQEVVLTGVHIGDYEDEVLGQKKGLEDLVESLLLQTSLPRLRLSSLEPVELTDRLLNLYSDPRLCPHFHMSIQSAETQVLSDMKRNYTSIDVLQSLDKIYRRVSGAWVGMDVIVGFPTETEVRFEETFKNLFDSHWTKIHVFPYSERPGTRAAKFTETVKKEERARRADRLRELSLLRQNQLAHSQLGTTKKVLALKGKKLGSERISTLSRDYWPVQISPNISAFHEMNEFEVKVSAVEFGSRGEYVLYGE